MSMDISTLSDELVEKGVVEEIQDMYIMPMESDYEISFRAGSQRTSYQLVSSDVGEQLISRFKYLGQMNVGEKRRAQLGAVRYPLTKGFQRLRLSTVGDYCHRESMVVRFLHHCLQRTPVYWIEEQLSILHKQVCHRGLYLFSGPVGSGKTTLMYQLAQRQAGQVITIEDPVEIEEPAFLQLQVNEKIQQTYEALVKLSLRHHPDILILGEIRDAETAKAAVSAALAGHRIFATVHARSVSGVYDRLKELGVLRIDLKESLQGIVYQELLMNPQGKAGVLLAYRFLRPEGTVAEETWEDSLQLWETRYKGAAK